MSKGKIDQLLAGFADGDAISQEAREIQRVLRSLGFDSEIYAPSDKTSHDAMGLSLPLEKFKTNGRDGVIYHYGIHSEATDFFLSSSCKKWTRYHNITPDYFFKGYDDDIAEQLRLARENLAKICEESDGVWAASDFNARELKKTGLGKVFVFPLVFSISEFDVRPDPDSIAKHGGGMVNWLFVGRMAPNKAVEDVILAFAWYNRVINPHSRLLLLGSDRSCPRYYSMLRLLASRLMLPNVCFEGFVSSAQRAACYSAAKVFVTASRHEGFCLPVVEAMVHNVPVIARNIGGVPEALGGSGILFDNATPKELAITAQMLIDDIGLRNKVLEAQKIRTEELRKRNVASELFALLGC